MASRRSRPVLWTQSADRDLDAVLDYLEEHNPRAGARLAQSVIDAIGHLSSNPEMGPESDLEPAGRYRQLLVARYLLIYRVTKASIMIMRVWDPRRDPASLRGGGRGVSLRGF